MWGEKKELRGGSIVEGEVAAGVGRVNKGTPASFVCECTRVETPASLGSVI